MKEYKYLSTNLIYKMWEFATNLCNYRSLFLYYVRRVKKVRKII